MSVVIFTTVIIIRRRVNARKGVSRLFGIDIMNDNEAAVLWKGAGSRWAGFIINSNKMFVVMDVVSIIGEMG